MKIILLLSLLAFFSACGDDNQISGEDHGNLAVSDAGLLITQDEHELGWGKAECFECHQTENIHQEDRTGTGMNLEAIQVMVEEEGLASCEGCHGDNGIE